MADREAAMVETLLSMVENANDLTAECIENGQETLRYYHRWLIATMVAWWPILLLGYWLGRVR